jgi:Protein of unknown function (DUF2971)
MSSSPLSATYSATLDAALASPLPGPLFHYTSSDGLIGILRARELWASNIAFLNDTKEVEHAVDCAKNSIENKLRHGNLNSSEVNVLEEMLQYLGKAGKRYYVASFSEDGDLLSQWRAYCPPGGGYSLGVPSTQLISMAMAQGFTLAPCIYDHTKQYRVVSEFADFFLAKFRAHAPTAADEAKLCKKIAWEFGQHLTRFGTIIKHHTFKEEREWRLISPPIQEPHEQLDYRGSAARVIPFFRFRLANTNFPNLAISGNEPLTVIIGPTSDPSASELAIQFLLTSLLGKGAVKRKSEIPYRTW